VVAIGKMKHPHQARQLNMSQKTFNVKPVAGLDRDEYPPAMFKEGGPGSSVRLINSSDNRGSGACIGAQCRGLPNGSKVDIEIGE